LIQPDAEPDGQSHRESGEIRQFDVQAGQVDWDKPTTEVRRAINVGRARYEEIVVFFLAEPGQDPQPRVDEPDRLGRKSSRNCRG